MMGLQCHHQRPTPARFVGTGIAGWIVDGIYIDTCTNQITCDAAVRHDKLQALTEETGTRSQASG